MVRNMSQDVTQSLDENAVVLHDKRNNMKTFNSGTPIKPSDEKASGSNMNRTIVRGRRGRGPSRR
jgi:hypothetical protein